MYRDYGPMVHRRCRRLLGQEDEASDAMHDVFVQLVRRKDKVDPKSGPGLLYKMATHVCLNRLRSRRRHPETQDERLLHMIACSDEVDTRMERRSLLGWLFKQESESTRVIAVLYFVDGMTYDEVAETVGMSVSGVRKRLRTLKAKNASLEKVIV